METFAAIAFGLILGSFVSVLVERWHTKVGIVAGRSECPNCHHMLAWYDLVPLGSWLWLRGRCRYCRAPIPLHYPAMELAMAVALGLYVFKYGIPSLWMLTDLFILFGLVALFFLDLRWRLLPDVFTFGLSAIVLARLIGLRPDLVVNHLATAAILVGAFGTLFIASRGRWLGLGDVKMALLVGLLFGYPGAVGVTLIAIWSGALWGVVLMARRQANMETALPFGSFWSAAAVLGVIWPGQLHYLSGLVLPYIR
jgi:leader peptidase (prepilin peptidase)/N-methyltransferase